MSSINVGVVGATGVVGEAFLNLLNARNFPVGNLKLFASEKSKGQAIEFKGKKYLCECLENGAFEDLDVVFFSSGDDISRKWAPHAVECGAFAIDNSAAFRMSKDHKLIVPEINGHLLPKPDDSPEVIANPNCSTIQLVVALAPLAKKAGIEKVFVATYQSVSGAGKEGLQELQNQTQEFLEDGKVKTSPHIFSQQIAFNSLPHIGSFNSDGFCSEEVKIMSETPKILDLPNLAVSAFTVRVPTMNGHGEAVWVQLKKELEPSEMIETLKRAPGIHFVEHKNPQDYPTVVTSQGEYPVFVGRLHRDVSDKKTWMMWVVADNLYKGAALNGLQIAEKIFL